MKKILPLLFAIFFGAAYGQTYLEIGKEVPTELINKNENHLFGNDVAVDGNIAVIGSPGYADNKGAAFVYEYNGGWSQVASLSASDNVTGDMFGYSVDISGDVIVVSAYKDNSNGNDTTGVAYVYEKPGSGWANMTETAKLTASDGVSGDAFGYRVRLDGSYAVVSATYAGSSGKVYVFEKPGSGWVDTTEIAQLTATSISAYDDYGESLAIDDSTIVVGASGDDYDGSNTGAVFVYEKPVSGWVSATEDAKLTASNDTSYYYFGKFLDIDGEYIVISGNYDDANGSDSLALLFERPVTGWADTTESFVLSASDGEEIDGVEIENDTIILFSHDPYYTTNVYVFQKPGAGWQNMTEDVLTSIDSVNANAVSAYAYSNGHVLMGYATDYNPYQSAGIVFTLKNTSGDWTGTSSQDLDSQGYPTLENSRYGQSLAIDGDVAVIGTNGNYAEVFEFDGSVWNKAAKLTASSGSGITGFGYSVAVSGDIVVVGAPYENSSTGAAYVFEKPGSGWADMTETAKLSYTDVEQGDDFGWDVAVDGDVVVVGCPDGSFSWTGAALVYEKPGSGWANMSETLELSPSDLNGFSDFGRAVDIDGDVIVVGAPEHDGVDDWPSGSGMTYVFEKSAGTSWSSGYSTSSLLGSNLGASDDFGEMLSVSGELIVVGSNNDSVYLFKRPQTGWANGSETALLAIPYYATDVLVEESTIFVSSTNYEDGGIPYNTGAVFVYNKPIGGWVDTSANDTIFPSDDSTYVSYDNFGNAMASHKGKVVVSAQKEQSEINNYNYTGSVYFFKDNITRTDTAICLGDSVYLQNDWQTTSGLYYDTLAGASGDSIVQTTLTVHGEAINQESALICYGDSIFVGGAYQTTAGTYYDTLASSLGCDSIVETTVSVNPALNLEATATDTLACEGDYVKLNGTGALSYVWDNGVTNDIYFQPPLGTTTYNVTGTDVNGCKDSASITIVVVDTCATGIASATNPELDFYPNPNNGTFFVDIPVTGKSLVQVVDISGKLVYRKTVSQGLQEIKLTEAEPGFYILKVTHEHFVHSERIIVN